jgi:SAM-dependent methyltransferase
LPLGPSLSEAPDDEHILMAGTYASLVTAPTISVLITLRLPCNVIFMSKEIATNTDPATIEGFGEEWRAYDQSGDLQDELRVIFNKYFELIDWEKLPPSAVIMDVGCGSGRWARFASEFAERIHLVDPSITALDVARNNLRDLDNCDFYHSSTENLPLPDDSCDLIYSLGVLHHIPNTVAGIADCVKKLKPGAPFLLYLYYRFDNRPLWFKGLWLFSNLLRQFISKLPFQLKKLVTDLIAIGVYYPIARLGLLVEKCGGNPDVLPLSFYRGNSLYTMRTDSLDRFGTRLEHRFTRVEIQKMMEIAGLENVRFRETEPFWCAVGYRTQHVH